MRAKNLVISSIGILILVASVVVIAWLLRAPAPYSPLILDAVTIRAAGNNSISKAKIIDNMDNNIGRVKENEILDKWDSLTNCLNEGCSDDDLLDFIASIVIARPDKVPNAKVVADIIVAGRFWGSSEVLKFSKAVTSANEAVAAMNSKDANKKWEQIVACDGKCPEKNTLLFEEVKLIIEKGSQK